jgi:hypothetical protein
MSKKKRRPSRLRRAWRAWKQRQVQRIAAALAPWLALAVVQLGGGIAAAVAGLAAIVLGNAPLGLTLLLIAAAILLTYWELHGHDPARKK